jgi:WD40 repeat protein
MAENSAESVVFIAGGATAGAGVSATVGGMGLAGGFGAIGIGMAPVTAVGAVAGAAAYGAFRAIADGDSAAFGAVGIGALGSAGVSATVGGMGLAGGFGAVGIGMGTMAAAGGVVGLGVYGLYKAFQQEPGQRMAGAIDAFGRMESKLLETEAYTQALLELELEALERNLLGDAVEQKFTALEMEQELQVLKAQILSSGRDVTEQVSTSSENQFTNPAIEAEILSIEVQQPQAWKCIKVLQGHEASVNTIAISPDGQTLASGSQDRTVSLWNLKTGKHTFTFFGQAGEVHTVAISPDGKMLVAGGFDNKITSWQLDTKTLLRSFFYLNSPYSHSGFVSCLAFSRDKKILASASGDKTIRLWGGYTGEIKRTLNGHSDTVWSVAISPDGNTLTSGSTDGTIKLWNLHNGEILHTMDGQSTGIFSVAISPDGQTLASGSMKAVKLWNIHTGELIQTLPGCSPVAFSADGQTLVTGSSCGTIKIWHQRLGSEESTLDSVVSGEWWEVLGVGMDAEPQAVKLAYRRLARLYHPDINRSTSAIAKMQALNKAYEEFLKEFSKVFL